MILASLVINNQGKPRMLKFYEPVEETAKESIVNDCYSMVSKRPDTVCNFLEECKSFPKKTKLIYRHYATLYFIFAVDETESELGILDLIQVFVEVLDKCFENVCELDLIYHIDKVHHVLDEIIMGGMVLETNQELILAAVEGADKFEQLSKKDIKKKAIGLRKE